MARRSKTCANGWLNTAIELLNEHNAIALASIAAVRGSTPCYVGSKMLITADCISGTIGGGSFEYEVMHQARKKIKQLQIHPERWPRHLMNIALGPDTGQCCGGFVRVLIEIFGQNEKKSLHDLNQEEMIIFHPFETGIPLVEWSGMKTQFVIVNEANKGLVIPIADLQQPLFLYGAGHISRKLAPMLDGLGFDPYWVDINQKRFPKNIPKGITKVIAKDPALISSRAPGNTVHIVITHSHSLDQAICHAVLASKDFSKLGLIGSKTKKARFKKRLEAAGVNPVLLKKLICPVGLQTIIGKTPQIVAISIAAQLAIWQQENNNCA